MFKLKKEFIVTSLVFCFLTIAIIFSIKLVYQNYKQNKFLLNGRVLCNEIMNASITYYKKNGEYLINDKVFENEEYPFDARTNPYFSIFSTYPIDENTQGISVFGTIDETDYELKVAFNKDDDPVSFKNLKIKVIKNKK
jgi:hypothetical protein